MKPTKNDLQKIITKTSKYEVIQPSAFSNTKVYLHKLQEALDRKAVIIILE